MKHALIIVNPVAGKQQPLEIAEEAATFLRRSGWSAEILTTQATGHATELTRTHAAEADLVAVVGGDGTLRETVIGLRGVSNAPVGFVPIGNANVVARELGIPRSPHRAIRVLAGGRARAIDVGTVGESIFLAMVGVGFDGWAIAGVGRMRATRWGGSLYRNGGSTLIYLLAGIPALFRLRPNRVRLRVDGALLRRPYPSVVVCNTETYGLGWAMTPGASVESGELDYQANRRSAPWFVLWTLGAAILRGRLPGAIAEYGRGTVLRIESDTPFRWQVDGDPMPPARCLDIGVLPSYAWILVPDRAADMPASD